jgi:hypothetical protein
LSSGKIKAVLRIIMRAPLFLCLRLQKFLHTVILNSAASGWRLPVPGLRLAARRS